MSIFDIEENIDKVEDTRFLSDIYKKELKWDIFKRYDTGRLKGKEWYRDKNGDLQERDTWRTCTIKGEKIKYQIDFWGIHYKHPSWDHYELIEFY